MENTNPENAFLVFQEKGAYIIWVPVTLVTSNLNFLGFILSAM